MVLGSNRGDSNTFSRSGSTITKPVLTSPLRSSVVLPMHTFVVTKGPWREGRLRLLAAHRCCFVQGCMLTFVQNLVVRCAHVGKGKVTKPVRIRVRLAAGLADLFRAPFLTVDLADGATVADLYAVLADAEPDAAPALRSALAVVAGQHAGRDDVLRHRQEVALLLPISGG